MWDGTDESGSNSNRSEIGVRSRIAQAPRSRRRPVEPRRSSEPEPPRTRRARRTDKTMEKTAEFPKSRTQQARRRLEVVPPPEPRRSKPARKAIAPPRPKSASALAFLYGTRLLILGIGIGVIAGTSLSIFDPASRTTAEAPKTEQSPPAAPSTPTLQLELAQEIGGLKTQIQSAIAPQTQLTPGLMVVDADTGAYFDINGSNAIPAASTIKFPILVAFFQAVDEGKVRLDQPLTLKKEQIAAESGDLQDSQPGSQFPAIQVATKMIDISDNTATNMIIDLLGGKEAVNQRFQTWGLTNTVIQNALPDLQGTNTSSPRDMVTLLSAVNSGKLVSMRSHERMLTIMRKVVNNSLIPQGLGQGAVIAHKTGDIGMMLGDVGMIDLPNGKRYFMAAMVKRPHNDDRAGDAIRKMSELTYQYFNQQPEASSPSPTLSPQTNPTMSPPVNPQGAEPSNPSTIAQP